MRHERLTIFLLAVSAITSAIAVVGILSFMILLGLPLLQGGRCFEVLLSPWDPSRQLFGILPMITGTVSISLLAIIISFPLSFGVSVFIYIYGAHLPGIVLRRIVELMTGLPTVIYGFVGVFLLVPLVREISGSGSGMCILSAGILLALLVAPTMILFFLESYADVPNSYLQAATALGATRVQRFLLTVLPCSKRGIIIGVVLALGRAMGDTLISLMIAGNAVAVPESLLDPARTLTAHIALVIAADFDSLEFRSLYICGILLYLLSSLMILLVRRFSTLRFTRAS